MRSTKCHFGSILTLAVSVLNKHMGPPLERDDGSVNLFLFCRYADDHRFHQHPPLLLQVPYGEREHT